MLKPVLTSLGVSRDGTTVTLKDSTGTYNASTNTGGYGSPNPIAPTLIGFSFRYWPDDLPYANTVIFNSTVVNAVLGAGYALSYADLGLTAGASFEVGVHQIKYYPFEATARACSLTENSAVLTVSGMDLTTIVTAGYVALVLVDNTGVPKSSVLLIDTTVPVTATTLTLQKPWLGATTTAYLFRLATEADLKLLVTAAADSCLADTSARLATLHNCTDGRVQQVTDLLTWKFAADVKFQKKDYAGAHNLIVAALTQCAACLTGTTSCKTCH